jgi:acetyl esterase/lipase
VASRPEADRDPRLLRRRAPGLDRGHALRRRTARRLRSDGREGSRPDFAVLCYAVISLVDPVAHAGSRRFLLGDPAPPALVEDLSNEKRVTARTPPTFLWHTTDDASVPVENSLQVFEALRRAGVPAELHVFPHGRHGLGLAPGDPAVSQWTRLCATWMEGLGLLKKAQP